MWKIAYVLPNIIIGTSIETDYLALVDYEDERITEIIKAQPISSKLLDGFLDDYKKPIKPTVLIYKDGFPENTVSIDSMVAFRNILAISTSLLNWSGDYTQGSVLGPLFSNSFDFYPVKLTQEGAIITDNPALLSFGSENAPFNATPSREVARVNIGLEDPLLFKPLLDLWKSKYELNNAENNLFRKIFRSLEMSYYALSIPTKNESSLYDFGLINSLWISAIEILITPKAKYVNKIDVIDLLKNHGFNDPKLNGIFCKIKIGENTLEINFIQKLYLLIYNFRSKFIHGDEIDQEIFEFIREYPKLSLLNAGPNLYRLILYLILRENNLINVDSDSEDPLNGFREHIINSRYEDYFLNVLNSKNGIHADNE